MSFVAVWWAVNPQNGDAHTLIEEVAGEASSGYAPIVNSYGMVGDRSISDGKQVFDPHSFIGVQGPLRSGITGTTRGVSTVSI